MQIALTSRETAAIHRAMQQVSQTQPPEEPLLALFKALFGDLAAEWLQVAYLDRDGKVRSLSEPERGNVAEIGLPLRRIIANALARKSAGVLLAHNHPSGDPSPSASDISATRHLVEVAHRLDIRVIDHFVIGGQRWTSFRALGLL